jgi:hypothetical protein
MHHHPSVAQHAASPLAALSSLHCGARQQQQRPRHHPSVESQLTVLLVPLFPTPCRAGYSEEQLRSLFQLCGNVAESRVVHDKQSGRPVGYGYVSFFTKEAADLAISTFDDQITLQVCAVSGTLCVCGWVCVQQRHTVFVRVCI